jgi:general stress protein 26
MPAPQPKAFTESELVSLAEKAVREAKFPFLSTVDETGQPRVRPISPVRVDGFTIYVANLRSYHKTREIAANPRVELCYLSPDHDQVRITGTAEIVSNAAVLREIWEANALLRQYLPSPTDPALIVYRIVPVQVRFMREWALEYHEVPLG